jgi:hypothetical protein
MGGPLEAPGRVLASPGSLAKMCSFPESGWAGDSEQSISMTVMVLVTYFGPRGLAVSEPSGALALVPEKASL